MLNNIATYVEKFLSRKRVRVKLIAITYDEYIEISSNVLLLERRHAYRKGDTFYYAYAYMNESIVLHAVMHIRYKLMISHAIDFAMKDVMPSSVLTKEDVRRGPKKHGYTFL